MKNGIVVKEYEGGCECCTVMCAFKKPVLSMNAEESTYVNDGVCRCLMSMLCDKRGMYPMCSDPIHSSLYIGLIHDRMNDDGSQLFLDPYGGCHLFTEEGIFHFGSIGTELTSHADLSTFVRWWKDLLEK